MRNKRKYDYIVYKTTNLANGKIYIGYDSFNRSKYYGSGRYLKNAIKLELKNYIINILNEEFDDSLYKFNNSYKKKYIPILFKKDILDYYDTKEDMIDGELKWIIYYNSTDKNIGYNLTKGGEGGDTFTDNPNKEEINQKRSKSLLEYYSVEENRLRGVNNANYGQKRTDATIKKLSEGKIGDKNPQYGNCGDKNNDATIYIFKNNNSGDIVEIINRKNVRIFFNCKNDYWYRSGRYKEYTLIDKRKINVNNKSNNHKLTKYFIETPNNDIIEIIGEKNVLDFLGCSTIFFQNKIHNDYKLIKKER